MQESNKACFTPFSSEKNTLDIPTCLNNPFHVNPPQIAVHAANELRSYLESTSDFEHNFGLGTKSLLKPHGKMFGVLVVENKYGELGYLMAFSGKLLGTNKLDKFVPPVGMADRDELFINQGMTALTKMGDEIAALASEYENGRQESTQFQIAALKEKRKAYSKKLQEQIFEAYYFSNARGAQKTLLEIFHENKGIRPPSGAGECAAPKLFQYAFDHELKPIAIAEFWWGKPRKSQDKTHGHFYPSCEDKCRPILQFMLS